jgi:thiamine biosynthesis lipoprotein
MNTDVQLFASDLGALPALRDAEQRVHAFEARFSRFRPDSELSRLNAASGETVPVSGEMLALLMRASEMHLRSGGAFDPSILPDLERVGYDGSFEGVPREMRAPAFSAPRGSVTFASVVIDPVSRTVRAPAGTRIDVGGIGKGYIVDELAAGLKAVGGVLVDAGGDVYAAGNGPDGDGWVVAVSDPIDPDREIDVVTLHDEAVATSTVLLRRWRRNGQWHNHLIDPRTREPVNNGVVSVSVMAQTATEADAFAKTALLLGLDEGTRFLERERLHGLFVMADGARAATAAWPGSSALTIRKRR